MATATTRRLTHPEGSALLQRLPDGRRRVTVTVDDPEAWVRYPTCETAYPDELVERLLDVKGPAWLCDEIMRDEHPDRVELSVRKTLLSHVPQERFAGARILDFGCGSGASTVVLARLFPRAEVVGVELDEALLQIARLRAVHYGVPALELRASPAPDRLADDLGTFDFVYLSAVWEHLLPAERRTLPAQLWRLLAPGGVLFVTETPYRWSPLETHSTGLPLINYLPAVLAGPLARRSPRVGDDESWPTLLRNGLRGATVREILRVLRAAGDGAPAVLDPLPEVAGSEEDLWFANGAPTPSRRAVKHALTAVNRATGAHVMPYLNVAIRKR
jgi:2-polyprenyl-3-methyl-5-hydroxy-6-metoxy-1,4-benzoquinol methylase